MDTLDQKNVTIDIEIYFFKFQTIDVMDCLNLVKLISLTYFTLSAFYMADLSSTPMTCIGAEIHI